MESCLRPVLHPRHSGRRSERIRGFGHRSFAFAAILLFSTGLLVAQQKEAMTPLLLHVSDPPVPFTGSDGRVHLVYELQMTNFSSAEAILERVEVLADGALLETLDASAITKRLQPAGLRESSATLPKSAMGLLFLNVVLPANFKIPAELSHRILARFAAAPPGMQEVTETGGMVVVDRREVARIGPPLRGNGYISADSCCDAVRHTRAALPVNGRVWIAQRFAVDWEQLDPTGRIYSGPREKLESYAIFGKPVFAVADSTVESVANGAGEQVPGTYPEAISLDAADGNSIILKLAQRQFALYAHLQPGSIRVRPGEAVKRGQVIALVGNTGNSVAPHLHFQLMDGPSSLASNGLPYEIDRFQVTGESTGTEAFDESEAAGVALAIRQFSPPQAVHHAMPLDQRIISFPPR